MKKLSGGELLAVWNPVPPNNLSVENRATGDRTPLVCAVSTDQGKTWSKPGIIEDDPGCGYCYTAILEIGNELLLAYCAGGEKDLGSCLNRLRIRKGMIHRGDQEARSQCDGLEMDFSESST